MSGDQSPDPSGHAREAPSVEERISIIADLMESLEFIRGKTVKRLAQEWGLSVKTVEGNASEASRRVTADADEVRREITTRGLKRLANAQDDKSFAAIGKLLADVAGANAPTKTEHKVTAVSLDELDEIKKSTGFDEPCPPKPNEPSS